VLFGKSPPQLGCFLTTEDIRCMARMDANEQVARKFGYRVHGRPSTESAALNQQKVVAAIPQRAQQRRTRMRGFFNVLVVAHPQ
jgi:hypothetical protein